MTDDALTLEYLVEFAREQQAAAVRRDQFREDRCDRCGHGFHGLPCASTAITANSSGPCLCPSALDGAK